MQWDWLDTVFGFLIALVVAYLARRVRGKPADDGRCVNVVWCTACGSPQSALCQEHKLRAETAGGR